MDVIVWDCNNVYSVYYVCMGGRLGGLLLLVFHTFSVYYVHAATEETYTVTQLNLAKLTKEPPATYQIRLWFSSSR